MASNGALHLSNSKYLENQTKYYNELLETQELSDVTLACSGYEIGAHKTVLSASSLFFREIIRKSKHPSPYIYLKGVSKESLEAVLEFIYKGEVTARAENLENLVDAGNELQIVGLMEEKSKTPKNAPSRQKNFPSVTEKKDLVETKQMDKSNLDFNIAEFVKVESFEKDEENDIREEQENVNDNNDPVAVSNNQNELAEEVAKRILVKYDEHSLKQYECSVCRKIQKCKTKMKMHIETHLEGFSHQCKFCGMVKKTTRALQLHVWDQHTRTKKDAETVDQTKEKEL